MNVEVELDGGSEQASRLCAFVRDLTNALRAALPGGGKVIWYDSVTVGGALRWQSQLNAENFDFFDACDGIFNDYVGQNTFTNTHRPTHLPEHFARPTLQSRDGKVGGVQVVTEDAVEQVVAL